MTEAALHASVVIVGTGMAGAHMAYTLARRGIDVLMLEAGPRRTRAESLQTFYENPVKGPQAPYPSVPSAPHPEDTNYDEFYVQGGPDRFIGAYLRMYGGTSWHWTGFADRLRPSDLRMRSGYGVGQDWPIDYQALEPYYEEVEARWGVAGHPDHVWGAPRRTPYPMPPIPMTYLDRQVEQALQTLGLHAAPFSHARNSVIYDQRPVCCGNNTCVPICPIGAKCDASVHAQKAEQAGARVVTDALVTFVEVGRDAKVSRVRIRRPDGSTQWVSGRVFALACHAIENPRLLLNSAQETAPNGVANSSDAVGRYLLTQANQDIWALARDPVYPYRGPQQTAGLVELRDGPFRSQRAAVGTSFMNSGWSGNSDAVNAARSLIGHGLTGSRLIAGVRNEVAHHLRLNSSAETLPDAANRIELASVADSAGVPKPKVTFRMDEYTREGLKAGMAVNRQILVAMGARNIQVNEPYLSNAIIAGTTRMGTDPRSSVVDPALRSHDHSNLFILGTSAHVTAPVNAPSLTVAALAIRAAGVIESELKKGQQ
ncbi:MAG: glucose dehydrogenase [Ramlibacter sp.]|nr:glucose dehydrogenase [Ramlibacter sp.]